MLWPGMKQPSTLPVSFIYREGLLHMSSETTGASIAYRYNTESGLSPWKLYSDPIEIREGEEVYARAVRLGFSTSDVTSFSR